MTPRTTTQGFFFHLLLYLVLFFAAADVFSQLILRGELVNLPDLTGRTLDEARTVLSAKKIAVTVQEFRFDDRVENGRIMFQNPAKGSRVKPHRTVKVVLSRGNERITVPRIEGRSLETAAQIMRDAGLRRGRVSQIHTSQAAAGRILAQFPGAGTVVDRSSTMDFLVSRGDREDRFLMPDLIEKDSRDVIRQLQAQGFTKYDITYVYYPDTGPYIVLKQTPIAGSLILLRNQIHLEVSR